ncbi:hypothetical protein Pelo_19877 [Pelomyxa schiedti]|nr:hypothetical protein Pelo_19877 [Pelomyxa schiedti]
MFFLVAPKDIIVARPRDMDDHIDWLLEKHKFAEALMECEHETPEGAKKYARIAQIYVNDLISKQETVGKMDHKIYRAWTVGEIS